jgi:hypothetical protein
MGVSGAASNQRGSGAFFATTRLVGADNEGVAAGARVGLLRQARSPEVLVGELDQVMYSSPSGVVTP